MRVLHVDSNHPILAQGLEDLGCSNEFDYEGSKEEILSKIDQYDGLIIRSRFTIDKEFIDLLEESQESQPLPQDREDL